MVDRMIKLDGDYCIEVCYQESYSSAWDEYPTGYYWDYTITRNGVVVSSDNFFDSEYDAVEAAFYALIDVEYDRTGFEYEIVTSADYFTYLLEVRSYDSKYINDGDPVVFMEEIGHFRQIDNLDYLIKLSINAHKVYINWLSAQENLREN